MQQNTNNVGGPIAASCIDSQANAKLKLESALGAAHNLSVRVRNLADGLCGAERAGQNGQTSGPVPVPEGVLPALTTQADALMQNVDAAHAALDRIERALT